ncbi:NUDIX domain-containing protein [Streptomyces mirabilis]
MSDSPHLLIADVAQVLLRANGAALCVLRKPDAVLAPGQLTVVGGHLEAGEGMDRITAVFVAQSWTGEPHNAEPDKHEGLFWVPMEKPPPACHPYTAAIFHMLTHGPSYRALNWPTSGGAR